MKYQSKLIFAAFFLLTISACGGGGSSSDSSTSPTDPTPPTVLTEVLRVSMSSSAVPIFASSTAFPSYSCTPTNTAMTNPNDPFNIHTDTSFAWHLFGANLNYAVSGSPADTKSTETYNVAGPWAAGITGDCVGVAIVDSGVDHNHEDLNSNFLLSQSYNYLTNSNDTTPTSISDEHGTNVAGVIGAIGNNAKGSLGIAPKSKLIAFKTGFTNTSNNADAMLRSSDAIFVSNNSWGPQDGTGNLLSIGSVVLSAIETGVRQGRNGKGIIYLVAAGNGKLSGDNSNYDEFANYRSVIAVGGSDSTGFQAPYAENGSNVLVAGLTQGYVRNADGSFYNNTFYGGRGVFATTITGMGSIANPTTHTKNSNYTDDFNGTSAATPGVSGVVALMLQANPNLTWRDVRWILAKTSRKVDTSSSSWEPAALGTSFSHMYGYGVPNASAAVASAQGFTSLSNLKSCSFTNQSSTQVVITNNSAAGKTFSLEASGCNLTIEFVEVQVNITHTYFGDLRITLTSPKNYKSYLAEPHNCTPSCSLNAYNWTFGSVRHLNETINGTWKIKVSDEGTGGAGSINIQKIVFWGH